LEASVQRNPRDHEAWYHLGLKQQENEREDQAIRALRRVVNLDRDYQPAYLALAVSLTNEGDREGANQMLERWIEMGEAKAGIQIGGTAAYIHSENQSQSQSQNQGYTDWTETQKRLVGRLIDMARKNPEEVDPEVQIALGVLFNATEVSEMTQVELRLGYQGGACLGVGLPIWVYKSTWHAEPFRTR
jgi:peroxin-5